MTLPADDARQGLEEITAGLDRVRTSLAGFFTNATQAVEEQHARVAVAEQIAEQAEAERDRAREQRNTWARQADAEILEHRQRADAAEAERDELHDALGLAPGQLHSAALSAIRGRGANIHELTDRAEAAERLATKNRERADRLAEELAERSTRDGRTEATLQRVRDADTLAQALTAVAEHDGLTPMQAAMSAAFAAAAETPAAVDNERERAHAIRLAEAEQATDRAGRVADRAVSTLLRIREAPTAAEAWAALGTYYGMTAAQAGQSARKWRNATVTIAERHARRAEADAKELAERLAAAEEEHGLTCVQFNDAAAARDRFEAAWQNARLRAKQAKAREQHARERAERYRDTRRRWLDLADAATDKEADRARRAAQRAATVRQYVANAYADDIAQGIRDDIARILDGQPTEYMRTAKPTEG